MASVETHAQFGKTMLKMRLQILSVLRNASENLNESGWLSHGINQTQRNLKEID